VYDELERVTTSCGLAWSVQDGALQIRERGQPVRGTRGALLRVDTGLIGDPEVEIAIATKDGAIQGQPIVHGVCLLRNRCQPGKPARVESLAFTGNLVIVKATYKATPCQLRLGGGIFGPTLLNGVVCLITSKS